MTASKNVSVTIEHSHKKEKMKKTKLKKQEEGNRIRLIFMLVLTFGYFLVEIVVGYLTNSVALIADSFHMLSDVISLIIAYIAVRISPKKWNQNTFGFARAEVLGALINAVFLVALCFTIVVDALERFIEVKEIENPKLILIVGTVGLLVNLVGLVMFREHGHSHGGHGHSHAPKRGNKDNHHGHSHQTHKSVVVQEFEDKNKSVDLVNWTVSPCDTNTYSSHAENNHDHPHDKNGHESKEPKSSSAQQMNMHGVFLHVLADALGSVIVIISALIIWLTKWEYRMYVDPLLSLLMVILIMCSVWPLFVESAKVLLQTVPTHIQIDELKKKLLTKVQGASEVHEFHIWQLSGNRIIASAHILCNNQSDVMKIGEEVKEFFHNEGIHSTTIQIEFAKNHNHAPETSNGSSDDIQDADSDTRSDCFLTCPYDDEDAECVSNSCCGLSKKKPPLSLLNSNAMPQENNTNENNDASNLGYIYDSDDDDAPNVEPKFKQKNDNNP